MASDPTEVAAARAYIDVFRKHTLQGAEYVDTSSKRRIWLDNMTDDDALFVAAEFQRIEAEAARGSLRRRRTQ